MKNPAPTSWTPLCPFHFDSTTYIPIVTKNPVVAMEEIKNGGERFAHQVLIHLVARDPAFIGSEDAETFLSVFIPQCQRAGAYLQMPGTVPENVNCPDGNYHDNRPQLFSTGLMQALFVSRGLFRLPFGLALRANPYMESIRNFAYREGALDVAFNGDGDRIERVEIDGKSLHCSLQIPDRWVQKETKIKAIQGIRSSSITQLVSSTLRLLDVSTDNDACTFVVHAYGKNELCFNREPDEWKIVGSNGSEVSGTCRHIIDHWWLEFDGVGEFSLEIR